MNSKTCEYHEIMNSKTCEYHEIMNSKTCEYHEIMNSNKNLRFYFARSLIKVE